jgi:hypothetical protein
LAQFGRRLFADAHEFLFFGVRFTRAVNSKPARHYTGLDTLMQNDFLMDGSGQKLCILPVMQKGLLNCKNILIIFRSIPLTFSSFLNQRAAIMVSLS